MSFEEDNDWYGELNDEWAEEQAAGSLAAQVARIKGLRPFPVTAHRLMLLMREKDYDVAAVGQLIETDVALASRVLTAANSSMFGLRTPCTSISHAVVLLGARTIGEITVALAVMEMFRDATDVTNWLRTHSLCCAGLARHLASVFGLTPDDVFTCSLMHDIGKLLLLQADTAMRSPAMRAPYEQLLRESENKHEACHASERKMYGYDHAILGAHVMKAWGIPDPVPSIVAYHHSPASAYSRGGVLAIDVCLVRLANRLSYLLDTEADQLDAPLVDEASKLLLSIDESDLLSRWQELRAVKADSEALLANA
jgi:putative nucleotidyltransferase with HDIG domain